MATTCAQAIKLFEEKNQCVAAETDFVKLYCQVPPIVKMDNALLSLTNCERLALSTNNIDRMISLSGMSKLKILSVGRNLIKKIEKLEDIGNTLEELWISYNQITSLDGLAGCPNLTTLYISNNLIKNWAELDKLQGLTNLRDVLFVGNPMYDDVPKELCRIEVLKHLPNLQKIDGDMVKPAERELAMGTHPESHA